VGDYVKIKLKESLQGLGVGEKLSLYVFDDSDEIVKVEGA